MFIKESNKAVITSEINPLRSAIKRAWDNYIIYLAGEEPIDVYEMFIEQLEFFLEEIMKYSQNNQCRASRISGISRGNLRKKLKIYGML